MEYPIFVHPAAVFRCLREYPKDLGVAAINEGNDQNLARLDGPVQALYEALNCIWREQYEAKFIQLEGNAASRMDDLESLDEQKHITAKMIQRAFDLLRDLQKAPTLTSRSIVYALGLRSDLSLPGRE